MKRLLLVVGVGLAMIAVATRPVMAQASEAPATQPSNQVDIMGHLGNSSEIEVPYWKSPYQYPVHLPQFAPVRIGGVSFDFSITKHLVFLLLSATLVGIIFVLSGRSVTRAQAAGRPPKGFAGAMEAMALYIRQEVVLPNVGHHGEGYAPYLLTVFFFILAANLLGLVPWGASATGNISVTAAPWPW